MEIETLTLTVSVTEFYQEREEIGHDIVAKIVSKKVFFFFFFSFYFFLTWERLICGLTEEKTLRREKVNRQEK